MNHDNVSLADRAARGAYVNRCALTLFNWLWKSNNAYMRCPIYSGCRAKVKDDKDWLARPWLKSKLPKTCAFAAATKILGLRMEQDFKYEPFPTP